MTLIGGDCLGVLDRAAVVLGLPSVAPTPAAARPRPQLEFSFEVCCGESSGALLRSVGEVCPAQGVKAAVGLGGSADGGLKGPRAAIKPLRVAGCAWPGP